MSTKEYRDEDVLFPDDTISVGGDVIRIAHVPLQKEEVTVRELTFGQTIRLEAVVAPIIDSIAEVTDGMLVEDSIDWGKVIGAIGRHPEGFVRLLCEATGKDEAWFEGLSDRDGRRVVVSFMKVNWDFFIDRLLLVRNTRASLKEVAGG